MKVSEIIDELLKQPTKESIIHKLRELVRPDRLGQPQMECNAIYNSSGSEEGMG